MWGLARVEPREKEVREMSFMSCNVIFPASESTIKAHVVWHTCAVLMKIILVSSYKGSFRCI